ncbi:MAG: hypothetical protein WC928_00660 [Patescibacteria group bacterium]|jgi:hypothetical protein
MSFQEDRILEKIFGEKPGQLAEKNYLGSINEATYNEIIKEKLYTEFLKKENLRIFNYFVKETKNNGYKSNTSSIVLNKIKIEVPEIYKDCQKTIEKIENRITNLIKNKNIFIKEISINNQLEIVKNSQPNKKIAGDPITEFTKDLKENIVNNLDIDPLDLKYYTAVGSHLDYSSGIDAFFSLEYKDEQGRGRNILIFIDITMDNIINKNEKIADKERNGGKYLADVIMFAEEVDYKRERDIFKLSLYTQKIIQQIKEKKEKDKSSLN